MTDLAERLLRFANEPLITNNPIAETQWKATMRAASEELGRRVDKARAWDAIAERNEKHALTASPDHADLIGRLEAEADSLARYRNAPIQAHENPVVLDLRERALREAATAIRTLTSSLSRVEGARETTADIDLPALRNWLREKGDVVAGIFPPQPISCANYLNAQRALGALIHCLSRARDGGSNGSEGK